MSIVAAKLVPNGLWDMDHRDYDAVLTVNNRRVGSVVCMAAFDQWNVDIYDPGIFCENQPLDAFENIEQAMLYVETKYMTGVV